MSVRTNIGGRVSLRELRLEGNLITDLTPLTRGALEGRAYAFLRRNPISCAQRADDIVMLLASGMQLTTDCP